MCNLFRFWQNSISWKWVWSCHAWVIFRAFVFVLGMHCADCALRTGCSLQLSLNKRKNKSKSPTLITQNLGNFLLCFMKKFWPIWVMFAEKCFMPFVSFDRIEAPNQSRRQTWEVDGEYRPEDENTGDHPCNPAQPVNYFTVRDIFWLGGRQTFLYVDHSLPLPLPWPPSVASPWTNKFPTFWGMNFEQDQGGMWTTRDGPNWHEVVHRPTGRSMF